MQNANAKKPAFFRNVMLLFQNKMCLIHLDKLCLSGTLNVFKNTFCLYWNFVDSLTLHYVQ